MNTGIQIIAGKHVNCKPIDYSLKSTLKLEIEISQL